MVNSCGLQLGQNGTLCRALGPAKENNDAQESPKWYIVSHCWEPKAEIPVKRARGRKHEVFHMSNPGIASLQAQSADNIVAKYVDVLGRQDVLSSITSIYQEGITHPMGLDSPVHVYIVAGKGFRTENQFNGVGIIQCLPPQGGG